MATKKKTSKSTNVKKKVTAKKPTKPQDMESTKDVQVTKSARQIVSGTDALIKVSIFTPGYEPVAYEIVIPNIIHTLTVNIRKPKDLIPAILVGLRKKFGNNVRIK